MAPAGMDFVSPLASFVPQTSLMLGIAGASSKLLSQLDTLQDATVCKSFSEGTQVAHSDSTPSDGFHSDSAPSDDDDDYGLDAQAEDSWLPAKAVADSMDRWLMSADTNENDPATELVDLDPVEGRRRGDLLMSMLDMTGGTYPVRSADKIQSRSGASNKGMGGSRLHASAPSFMPSHEIACMWGECGHPEPAFPPALPVLIPRQPLQDAIARHKSHQASEKTALRSPLVASAPVFTPNFARPAPGQMPPEDPPLQQGGSSAFGSVLCMGASYGSGYQEGQCWDFMQTGECRRKACRWAHVS